MMFRLAAIVIGILIAGSFHIQTGSGLQQWTPVLPVIIGIVFSIVFRTAMKVMLIAIVIGLLFGFAPLEQVIHAVTYSWS